LKEKLLQLLSEYPATAGLPEDFLGSLADDLQAVIIRAMSAGDPNDPLVLIEHQVEDVYLDHFGVLLSNLYTIEPFNGKRHIVFSARARVVKSMIQAMLLEQETIDEADVVDFGSEQHGATIKRRLTELNGKPILIN